MDKNYTTYNIDQLVQDVTFTEWVLNKKNNEAWQTWIALQSEIRKIEILKAKDLVSILGHNNKSSEMDFLLKKQIWNRIETTIGGTKPRTKPTRIVRMVTVISAIAASVLFLLIFKPFSADTEVEIYASSSQLIHLPQDSKVQLSEHATLTYNTKDWKSERRVNLEGEAFFNVTKGQQFIVDTKMGSVHVLGTSFAVDAHQEHLLVDVSSGRVKVATYFKDELLLKGDRYFYNVSLTKIKTLKKTDGKVYYRFKDQSLKDMLKILAYQYNITINDTKANVSDVRRAGFDSEDSVEAALEKILYPSNLKFYIEEDRVTVL